MPKKIAGGQHFNQGNFALVDQHPLTGLLTLIEGAVEILDLDYSQTLTRSSLFSSLRTNLKKANVVMGFILPDEALGDRPSCGTIATETAAQSGQPNGAADGDGADAD